MTVSDPRLPGRRKRPITWTPSPTTPARSWVELAETLQGGLAVIDDDWRLVFVSQRFLPTLGVADDLVGDDIRQLLPSLAANDPRALRHQIEQGARVEFEERVSAGDDDRWFQVVIFPSNTLGGGLGAVAFTKDITDTHRTLAQLRDATVGLTEIESELHRRVGRDVHDGPIQLLAALMFRLGMSDTEDSRALQQTVSEVATMLRHVIAGSDLPRTEGALLEQWIAPFLIDSEVAVEIEDRRSGGSSQAETQAAFVLLYQLVRGVRYFGRRRTIRMVLTSEDGGERSVVSFPSSAERDLTAGRAAAQHRATVDHARALGGMLSTWLDENEVRVVSMWIPRQAGKPVEPQARSIDTGASARVRPVNDVTLLPPLDDRTWLELANAAPERLVEFDEHMRISFANAVQHELIGVTPDQLMGLSAESLFSPESLSQLEHAFERLDAGDFVETDWYRENALGDSRLIHLRLSPRLDAAGRWRGLFLATDDRTEIELLESLYHTALADLTYARRLAIERSIHLLDEPLAECERLIDQLKQSTTITSHSDSIRAITSELEVALLRIKGSTSVLVAPRLSVSDLGVALRSSLGTLLDGRRLVVIDNTDPPPSADIVDVIFRIAREAVNNAVLHGKAGFITITLGRGDEGITCHIHDNGIGVDPDRLRYRAGHLGTRAMRERARERGGTCRIEPDERGGTTVRVWLPDHSDQPPVMAGALAPS